MCVACDKRFNLTSGLESAGNEYHHKIRLQSSFESKSGQDLTSGLESAGHESSPQSHISEKFFQVLKLVGIEKIEGIGIETLG